MAERFTPVKPKIVITGTGMSSDSEAIEALKSNWAQRVRSETVVKKKFGKVLEEAVQQSNTKEKETQNEK